MSESTSRSASFKVDRFHAPAGARFWFSGVIDEQFPADAFDAAHGVVVVDLGGITRVTSFGIRQWCQTLLGVDASTLYFANVAPCVVAQFAMVAGFAGEGGQILSYQGLYECSPCGTTTVRTFDRRTDPDEVWAAGSPDTLCTACGQQMEFSEASETYRIALMTEGPLRDRPEVEEVAHAGEVQGSVARPTETPAPRPRPRESVDAALVSASPFEVTKQVNDKATLLWLSGAVDASAGLRHVADGLEGNLVLVAPGVTSCDDAGLGVLASSCAAALRSGGKVWLARCSPVLVAALARHRDAIEHGTALTSVEEMVSCPKCHGDLPYFDVCSPDGERGAFCCRCHHALAAPAGPLAEALSAIACATAPAWLPPLIAARPAAPRPPARVKRTPAWVWGAAALVVVAGLVGGATLALRGPQRRRGGGPALQSPADEVPAAAPAPPPPASLPAVARPARGRPTTRVASAVPRELPAAEGEHRAAARTLDELVKTHAVPGENMPATSDDTPQLPPQLTTEEIRAGMKALDGPGKDCYEQFRQKGTVLVEAVISPGGRMQSVSVGGLLADSPTGACVQRAARHLRFPRFSGAAMSTTYAVELK